MEYASKGVAGAGLGLGIAGTALGVLSGGLGDLLGNVGARNSANDVIAGMAPAVAAMVAAGAAASNNKGYCSENTPVSRYELGLEQKNADLMSQIALRDANIYGDQKLLEVYKYFDGELKGVRSELCDQKVYNATNMAAIGCIQNQVNQLMGLTKLVVPNSSVCPGWGQVKVTPVTETAAS